MRERSQASAGMAGVGSWGVDGGDGKKWPKSGALTGRAPGGKRTGQATWQWGQARL